MALVTGGVRGLGLAVARRMSRAGVRCHLTWRSSEERARDLEPEFPGRIHRAEHLDEAANGRLVRDVLARDGRLDHLVHAVGEFARAPLARTPLAAWRSLQASNVETALAVFSAARAALRETAGSVVFFGVSGTTRLKGRLETAAYAAAKSSLVVLARSLAREEGPFGVRVNVVSPGFVPHDAAEAGTALPPEIPLGRAGTLEELAEAAFWLASPEAGYVTGQNLEVDGGWAS